MSEISSLTVNGRPRALPDDIAPETPLLDILRNTLRLTGTRFGCGLEQCGACMVLWTVPRFSPAMRRWTRWQVKRSRRSRDWRGMAEHCIRCNRLFSTSRRANVATASLVF